MGGGHRPGRPVYSCAPSGRWFGTTRHPRNPARDRPDHLLELKKSDGTRGELRNWLDLVGHWVFWPSDNPFTNLLTNINSIAHRRSSKYTHTPKSLQCLRLTAIPNQNARHDPCPGTDLAKPLSPLETLRLTSFNKVPQFYLKWVFLII